MILDEYLRGQREDCPAWLDQFQDGDAFSSEAFFGSRVVYYPGSGTDGHPVKLFGSTHSAHCFIYVDYGVTHANLEANLRHPRHSFLGYHRLVQLPLHESDLIPGGWAPRVHNTGEMRPIRFSEAAVVAASFGFLEVLERDNDLDDNHGARRLAILFITADAIAAYEALFCNHERISQPFTLVLQDHGFGGNYDRFGSGGLLERIARSCDVVPQWLLIAEKTRPWNQFERVPNVDGDRGGMHDNLRFLHRRREDYRPHS